MTASALAFAGVPVPGSAGSVAAVRRAVSFLNAPAGIPAVRRARHHTRAELYSPDGSPDEDGKKNMATKNNVVGPDYGSSGFPLTGAPIANKAKDFGRDLISRPGFYVQLVGVLGSLAVAYTVLQSVVTALDTLPVVPSLMELIGLGYSVWFAWRYLVRNATRVELKSKIYKDLDALFVTFPVLTPKPPAN